MVANNAVFAVTDLCPLKDGGNAVRDGESHQVGSSLTLYHLSDELTSLLAVREEMAEGKEDTSEIDAAIAEYMAALPQKVDAVVHVIRTLESQAELAAAEIHRLSARRRNFASAVDRLKEYCCSVIERMPKPKKGSRKLEGETASLVLKTNGGLQPLDIYDEALVPDEYKIATVSFPAQQISALLRAGVIDILKTTTDVNNATVREALGAPCWLCEGHGDKPKNSMGEFESCSECGGSGKASVPGARLLDRSSHLEIR